MMYASKERSERTVRELASQARNASRALVQLSNECRNEILMSVAKAIENSSQKILEANERDCHFSQPAAEAGLMSSAMFARLKVNEHGIREMAARVRDVARLTDPLGRRLSVGDRARDRAARQLDRGDEGKRGPRGEEREDGIDLYLPVGDGVQAAGRGDCRIIRCDENRPGCRKAVDGEDLGKAGGADRPGDPKHRGDVRRTAGHHRFGVARRENAGIARERSRGWIGLYDS